MPPLASSCSVHVLGQEARLLSHTESGSLARSERDKSCAFVGYGFLVPLFLSFIVSCFLLKVRSVLAGAAACEGHCDGDPDGGG